MIAYVSHGALLCARCGDKVPEAERVEVGADDDCDECGKPALHGERQRKTKGATPMIEPEAEEKSGGFEGWAVLELMGHRKLAGRVTEAEIAGKGFIRLDVPGPGGKDVTQFYSPAAVYALTPTTEDLARAMARRYEPQPVSRYELPPAEPRSVTVSTDDPIADAETMDDDDTGDDDESY